MFETGIKVIDLIEPYLRGGKIGLFGGAGVGKTVIIRSSSTTSPRSTAACRCSPGVGERTREGNDLWLEFQESGVIDIKDPAKCKAALIYGQMTEPPGARLRVALTGLTVAEYFRDDEGKDVLLFIDNIFRFTQAGSEVSALLGRMPSRGRLPAHPADGDGRAAGAHHLHQEGLDHLGPGHLRARRRLHRPRAGHHLRPPRRHHQPLAPDRRARHLPRGGPAGLHARASSTRASSARSTTTWRATVKQILQRYKDLQDIIAILGHRRALRGRQGRGGARAQDPALPVPALPRGRAVHGHPRQVRPLADNIRSFKMIVNGELDDLPEQAFYMVGAIEEVFEQAKKLQK